MRVTSKVFWLAKAGGAPEEYEDAYWPGKPTVGNGKRLRFAVADGATETSFSGLWARDLVRAYGKGWFAGRDLGKPISALRAAWQKHFEGKSLPWYAEEKLGMGAFSSLVGLTLAGSTPYRGARGAWAALSIGDSCLFQVRDSALLMGFPLERSEQFNNRPFLLSTNPDNEESVLEAIARKRGEWKAGDIFYLMTDALACWLLRREEEGEKRLKALANLQTQNAFNAFVQQEREEPDARGRPRLRNDDVTFVCIEMS